MIKIRIRKSFEPLHSTWIKRLSKLDFQVSLPIENCSCFFLYSHFLLLCYYIMIIIIFFFSIFLDYFKYFAAHHQDFFKKVFSVPIKMRKGFLLLMSFFFVDHC